MTPATPEPLIGQGTLWTPAEMRMPQLSDLDIDPEQVMSMSRLLRTVSEYMDVPAEYVATDAYALAKPETVHEGLYIERSDPRFRTAENLVDGVVHPSKDFRTISRNPRALAAQAMNNTRNSFTLEEAVAGVQPRVVDNKGKEVDRDEIEARVKRSAGHQLEGYAARIENRRNEISAERLALRGLHKELKSGGRAHYKAKNLNTLREQGERSIRTAVEVASINMDWGSVTVDGLHKAVMYKMYGLPGHNNARLHNFADWALLTGLWTRARLHGFEVALRNCLKELAHYEPALRQTDASEAS